MPCPQVRINSVIAYLPKVQRGRSRDEDEIDLRPARQRPLTADDAVTPGGGVGPDDRPAR